MPGLAVSDVINVQVLLGPTAAPTSNFGTLLLLGASAVIDTAQRIRQYSTLTQVANDFGTSAPEYLAANLFFSQTPQPSILYIGRWAKTATNGLLHGGTLGAAQTLISLFTAITGTGSMLITIDGTQRTLSTLNFSSQTNLNGVASVLNTALSSWASCTWNGVYSRFEIISNTTGASSSVTVATPTGGGQDVSTLLGLTTALGATPVTGQVLESMLTAVNALATASGAWYGLMIADPSPANSDIQAVAAYIEGNSSPNRTFFVNTADGNALNPNNFTDIGSLLNASGYNRSCVQYSSSSPYAAASLFARQATVDFTANNSTITLMWKQEPGVVPESITEGQAAALKAKKINVFTNYQNGTAIIQWGTMASGQYIDTVIGMDWQQNDMQTAVFNLLYLSPTKVQQTDAGINQITNVCDASMARGVNNGLVAPGVWTGPNLGAIQTGQFLSKGYYIYTPPIAQQSTADRGARKAPTLQIAIKLGGAVHTASVLLQVNS